MRILFDAYDWVVLGDHPGALLSGVLAAGSGLKVLALPLGKSNQSRVVSAGSFHDPETGFFLGIKVLEKIIHEKSQHEPLLTEILPDFVIEDHLPQILGPDYRVAFEPEKEQWLSELNRVFHGRFQKLPEDLDQMQHATLKHWADHCKDPTGDPTAQHELKLESTKQIQSKLVRSKLFQERKKRIPLQHAYIQALSYASLGTTYPQASDLTHALSLLKLSGAVKGGASAFRQKMISVLKKLGAHVLDDTECARLFIEGRKLVGVQTALKGKVISVKSGVLGADMSQASKILYFSGPRFFQKLKVTRQPIGWVFTVSLTVHAEAIPPGMNRRAVWMEPGSAAVEIEISDPDQYGLTSSDKPSKEKLIFGRTVLPYDVQTLSQSYQKTVAARLFRLFQELFPYLEFHVSKIFPDFRKEGENLEQDFKEAYGFTTLADISQNLLVYPPQDLGVYSGIRGLYLANYQSFPSMGSFGGLMAGLEISRRIHPRTLIKRNWYSKLQSTKQRVATKVSTKIGSKKGTAKKK